VDELYEVLKAFKTQDADGDGNPNNELPMDFANKQYAAGIQNLAGWWGIYNNYNVKDGKIVPSVNTPEYRAYLEYFHKLIAEGLINPEGFSQTGEQYVTNIKLMNRGVIIGWSPASYTSKEEDIKKYVVLPFQRVPGKPAGVLYGGGKDRIQASRTAFVLSRNGKNKEAARRWWDYLSSTQDMAMIAVGGPEGVIWEKKGDRYVLKEMSDEQAATYKLTTGKQPNTATLGLIDAHPVVLNNITADPEKFPWQSGVIRYRAMETYYEYLSDKAEPKFLLTREKSEERNLLEVDLIPYIDQFRANAILNGFTDREWNDYAAGLNAYRYDDYLKWMQDYYDHNF
jgi:putative aldouronate transport system substrate-binding protein